MVEFTLNGVRVTVDADDDLPLLWLLREQLGLTGTKYGCGVGVCGACTLQVDGQPVRACQTLTGTLADRKVVTIEGLGDGGLHPCQRAWLAEDVAQCGYCQPGMLMEAAALLARDPDPSDGAIDAAFAEHVCRCGTYARIRAAIHRAAAEGGR